MKAALFSPLARRIAVTLGVLALFRIGSGLLSPSVSGQVSDLSNVGSGGVLQMKGAQAFSLFGLGVTPYVSAALLVTLIGRSVPYLQQLRQGGPDGAARLQSLVRWVSLTIALMTSVASSRARIGVTGGRHGEDVLLGGVSSQVVHVLFQLAGFLVLLALAEIITRHGVGNGVSVMLVATVLAGLTPSLQVISSWAPLPKLTFIICTLLSMVAIGLAGRWVREFEVYTIHPQFAHGRAGTLDYRVTAGGAGPMLFAGSLLVAISSLVRILPLSDQTTTTALSFVNGTTTQSLFVVAAITGLLARFYANVASDPVEAANAITSSGRFLRGSQPGLSTARRLAMSTNAAGWLYALVLLPVACWPALLQLTTGEQVPGVVAGTAVVIPMIVAGEVVATYWRRRA